MSSPSSQFRRFLLVAALVPVLTAVPAAAPAFASGGGGGSVTPALQSISFSPATVVGTGGETATVSFVSAPSQGAVVNLTSSNPAVAGFPPTPNSQEVVVQAGHSSAAFAIVTAPVSAPTTVTITGSAFGTTTVSATLTVTPGAPPAPDTVRVTRFQWAKGIQTIQATDSNPNAILTVLDQDGTFTGITLTNRGGGQYQDQRSMVFRPDQPIVVKSNFGGSATATVT